MRTIQNMDDYNQVISQNKPILLDFYADWCGPCQALLPTVDKLSQEYEGKVEILKVNVDQNQELARKYGIRSIPALYFIHNDEVKDKIIGAVPESHLRQKLDSMIN